MGRLEDIKSEYKAVILIFEKPDRFNSKCSILKKIKIKKSKILIICQKFQIIPPYLCDMLSFHQGYDSDISLYNMMQNSQYVPN